MDALAGALAARARGLTKMAAPAAMSLGLMAAPVKAAQATTFPGAVQPRLSQIMTNMLQGGRGGPVTVGVSDGLGTEGGQAFVGQWGKPGYYDPVTGKPTLAFELGRKTANDALAGGGVGVMDLLHEYAHAVLGIGNESKAMAVAIATLPYALTKYWNETPARAKQEQAVALQYLKSMGNAYQLPANFNPATGSAAPYQG